MDRLSLLVVIIAIFVIYVNCGGEFHHVSDSNAKIIIFVICSSDVTTSGHRWWGRGCGQIPWAGKMWLQSSIYILRQFMQHNVQNNGTVLRRRMLWGLPLQRWIWCFFNAGYLCANRIAIMQIRTSSILNRMQTNKIILNIRIIYFAIQFNERN